MFLSSSELINLDNILLTLRDTNDISIQAYNSIKDYINKSMFVLNKFFVITDILSGEYYCTGKYFSTLSNSVKLYDSIERVSIDMKYILKYIDKSRNIQCKVVTILSTGDIIPLDTIKGLTEKRDSTVQKRKLNKEALLNLSIGDTVRVRRTGEVGVITEFVCYGTGQDGEKYDYTAVKVYFENKSGCRKNRRYSARNLIKLF